MFLCLILYVLESELFHLETVKCEMYHKLLHDTAISKKTTNVELCKLQKCNSAIV